MAFLAESYNISTIDIPLTERLIGQTWLASQNANVDSIKLYTGLYEDYVHTDSTYDWNNEYERLLLFQTAGGGSGFWSTSDPEYIPHFRGSRNIPIPTGSRFMVRIRHAATTTPGTIQFTVTNIAGSETIVEVHAVPVYAGTDEVYTDFYLTTLTTVDWDDAQISYSVLTGAMTPLQIYLFPIFPMTAYVQVAIHEVDVNGNISAEPIDNGVSTSLDASGWTAVSAQRTFTFATPPYIEAGHTYVFVVEYVEFFYETAQFNNSSVFVEADDTTLSYTNGEGYIYEGGEWGDSAEYGETDLRFEIWYEDTVTPPSEVYWPSDCIAQIAAMADIVSDIQAILDTYTAAASSEYTVRSYNQPSTTTFQAEWVRDERTLPLNEDFQYQWYNKKTNSFGGKYIYIGDEIHKNENEFIRGNTQLYPVQLGYGSIQGGARHQVISRGLGLTFSLQWPAKLLVQIPLRSFSWYGQGTFVWNLNDTYGEEEIISADTYMPQLYLPEVYMTSDYTWILPHTLHPGDYEFKLGLIYSTTTLTGYVYQGGGILPPGVLWMGYTGLKPVSSAEGVNLWLYRI